MTVSRTILSGFVKIYIDGLLHLSFYKNRLSGVQSWYHGPDFYAIELTLSDAVITTEYDSREKWEQILRELDQVLP